MIGLRSVMIVAVLMALILVVFGEKDQRLHARHAEGRHGGGDRQHHGGRKPCTDNPQMNPYKPPCNTSPAVPVASSTTTTNSSTTSVSESLSGGQIDTSIANSSLKATALERAHWCRFPNGTFVPLGYTYIRNLCSMCQCTTSHAIHCQMIECLPTYCLDHTMPIRKSDQCCTQCATDVAKRNSCIYNGVSFPHGAVMKTVEYKMQCWCQLGDIECRNYMGSLLAGLSAFTDSTTIYIILMIVFVSLLFGLLLCCSCSLFLYHYVQQNQHAIQQAYNEYAGTGGWEPIIEEETDVFETTVDEKHLVPEKYSFENPPNDAVPPPYAIYDDSYAPTNEQKKI